METEWRLRAARSASGVIGDPAAAVAAKLCDPDLWTLPWQADPSE